MQKIFTEMCPITNSEQSINVDYIPYSSLGSIRTYYTKGRFSCSNHKCDNEDCPLYNNAPVSF